MKSNKTATARNVNIDPYLVEHTGDVKSHCELLESQTLEVGTLTFIEE